MARTIKKPRTKRGGGFQCATTMLNRQHEPSFIYDRDVVVYKDNFTIPTSTTRAFVYENEEHPEYNFTVNTRIVNVHTHFRYELNTKTFDLLGGIIRLEYVWEAPSQHKHSVTLYTDGIEWFTTVDGNDDDFSKYMSLKTYVDNHDSQYICGAAYQVFNTIIEKHRNTAEAKATAHDVFNVLLSVLQKPIDPLEHANFSEPIPVVYRAMHTPKSKSKSKSQSSPKEAPQSPPAQKTSPKVERPHSPPPAAARTSPKVERPHSPPPAAARSSPKASPDFTTLTDMQFINKYMLPVTGLKKCIDSYKMIERTKNNPRLGHYLFKELDVIFKDDAKIAEFRKHVNENLEEFTALADKPERELKNNTKWTELQAKFEEYKTRLRRVALFACHTDKLSHALTTVSTNSQIVEKAKDLMKGITSSVNGQLDSNDAQALLKTLSLKDYIKVPKQSPPRAARPTKAAPKRSPASASSASPRASGSKCVRDDRTCSPKAAKDGRGPTKEELVEIALKYCHHWGMTEAEIRRLSIPQLCARIKKAP